MDATAYDQMVADLERIWFTHRGGIKGTIHAMAHHALIQHAPKSEPTLHYARSEGYDIEAMKNSVRLTPLYQQGDCKLAWVNEGDLAALQMLGWAKDMAAGEPAPVRLRGAPGCGGEGEGERLMAKTKYVIINDIDAPEPAMVCQWVSGIGYCYLDRRAPKPRHDGMKGGAETSIEAFGLSWADNLDGTVSFYPSDRPVTATYRDGEPRRWQSRVKSFEFQQLKAAAIRERARADG